VLRGQEREVLLEDNIAQLGLQEAFSQTNSGQGTGTGGEAVSSASTFGLGANIAAASSPSAVAASYFDSNCITPGTDFMFRLGVAFRGCENSLVFAAVNHMFLELINVK
jgi:hypothetical protein